MTEQVDRSELAKKESYPVLAAILIVLAAAIPIIALPGGYFGFVPIRQWFLTSMSLLTLVILFAYWLKRRNVTLWLTGAEIPWASLLLAMAISTVLSRYVSTSFWGSFVYREGLITWAVYFIVFFLAAQVFREKRDCSRLVRVLKYASVVIAAYGILQFAGADPLKSLIPTIQGKASSFLGSPGYLGGYLVLVAPVFLCLAVNPEAPKKERRDNALIFAFLTITVVLTASMAAWIALALVVALVISYSLFERGYTSVKALLIGFGGVLLTIVVIFGLALGTSGEFRRQTVSSSADLPSRIAAKTNTWLRSFSVIADKPLLGHGLGTFEFVFPAHLNASWEKRVGHDSLPDDANNIIIGITSAAGLVGFAVFVWLMLSILERAAKRVFQADKQTRYLMGGFLLGALGYLVVLFFHPSIIVTTALFWLLIGCALGMPYDKTTKQEQTKTGKQRVSSTADSSVEPWQMKLECKIFLLGRADYRSSRSSRWVKEVNISLDRPRKVLLAWFGLVVALSLFVTSVMILMRPVVSDVYLRKARDSWSSGEQSRAVRSASLAASWDTIFPFDRLVEGRLLHDQAIATNSPNLIRQSEEKLKALVKDYPDWETAAMALGSAYLADFESWPLRLRHEKIQLLLEGSRVFEAIVKRDPESVDAQVKLARFELYLTAYDRALNRLEKVFELKPNWAEPYVIAGQCCLWKGQRKKAALYFRKARLLPAWQTVSMDPFTPR